MKLKLAKAVALVCVAILIGQSKTLAIEVEDFSRLKNAIENAIENETTDVNITINGKIDNYDEKLTIKEGIQAVIQGTESSSAILSGSNITNPAGAFIIQENASLSLKNITISDFAEIGGNMQKLSMSIILNQGNLSIGPNTLFKDNSFSTPSSPNCAVISNMGTLTITTEDGQDVRFENNKYNSKEDATTKSYDINNSNNASTTIQGDGGKVYFGAGIAGNGTITHKGNSEIILGENSVNKLFEGTFINEGGTVTIEKGANFFSGKSTFRNGTLNWYTNQDGNYNFPTTSNITLVMEEGTKLNIGNSDSSDPARLTISNDGDISNADITITENGILRFWCKDGKNGRTNATIKNVTGTGTINLTSSNLTINNDVNFGEGLKISSDVFNGQGGSLLTLDETGSTLTTKIINAVNAGTNKNLGLKFINITTDKDDNLTIDSESVTSLTTQGNVTINGILTNTGGTVNVNTDSTLAAKSDIVNDGTINNKGELSVAGNITGSGTVNNSNILTLSGYSNSNTVSGSGTTYIDSVLNNTGNINQAVVINDSATLTSNISNLNGTIENKGILNLSGNLAKTISGIGTTKVNSTLTLRSGANIEGILSLNNGTLTMSGDNAATNYNVGELTGDGKLSIDLIMNEDGSIISDSITASIYGDDSITIDINNLIDGDINEGFTITVLEGYTGSNLELEDSVKKAFSGTIVENKEENVGLKQNSNWDDKVGIKSWIETKTKSITTSGGDIIYTISEAEKSNEQTRSDVDTLAALNQTNLAEFENRSFTTTESNKTYTVTENLGITGAGTLLVQGANDGENISTIDMADNTGFVVGAGSAVTLNTVKVTGTNTDEGSLIRNTAGEVNFIDAVVNISANNGISNDSTLNIQNSTIQTGITGDGTTKIKGNSSITKISQNVVEILEGATLQTESVSAKEQVKNEGGLRITLSNDSTITGSGKTTIAGTVNNTGSIAQAVEILNGSALTSNISNLSGSITNNGTLNLSGTTLDKSIAGNGETIAQNNMTLGSNAQVNGTFNLNDKTFTMSGDNSADTINIGTLTGNGNLEIDVLNNGTSVISDAISADSYTSGQTITITNLNNLLEDQFKSFEIEVLKGGDTTNVNLVLDSSITNQDRYKDVIEQKQQAKDLKQHSTWDDKFGTEKWTETTERSLTTENGKIKFTVGETTKTNYTTEAAGDTLAALNQNLKTEFTDRSFTTTESNKTYTVTDNLGTTGAGTLLVQGAEDKTSKLNMDQNTGFELSSAGTEVSLKNLTVENIADSEGGLIKITNSSSTANLEGISITSSNTNNVILSNGTIKIKDSLIKAGVNNTGTLNIEGTSEVDKIVGDTGITNIKGQTTTGSIDQKSVDITTGGKLIANGDITVTDGIKNAVQDGLEVTSGMLNANVTGEGSTKINGDVEIKDGSIISQKITVAKGTLTTSADSFADVVTNNSTVKLTKGNLNALISGGTINIAGDVSAVADNLKGEINSVNASNTLTLTGGTITNAISGTGNINITGNVTNNAKNTISGTVSVSEGAELSVGTSNDIFSSANSLTMANGSTLNLQNAADTPMQAVINNLVIGKGDTVNVKIDWKDTLKSSSNNINGTLLVTDINLANTNGVKDSYEFTNLGEKVSLDKPLHLSGVTDKTNNYVSYDSATGYLTSSKNSLLSAVESTEEGSSGSYAMTTDETAGQETLSGTLLIQGNGNSIVEQGIVVGSDSIQKADLTLEDVNFKNIEGNALTIYGGNKTGIVAKNTDVTIASSAGSGIVLNSDGSANFSELVLEAGKNTITIDNNIISDNKNNKVIFKSGDIQFNGLFDPANGVVEGANVTRNGQDDDVAWTLNSGRLYYTNDTYLNKNNNSITFNGGNLDTRNGAITTFNLSEITLNNDTTSNFYADVDLASETMDNFGTTTVSGSGKLNIAGVNLISDAKSDNTTINFTKDSTLQAAVNYSGEQGIEALAPIYKYNVGYDNETGDFNFQRYKKGNYGDYNPAVLASSVAAQLGGYLNQLNSYDEAFRNMDMYMLMTSSQRQALKNKNKVASLNNGVLYDASLMRQERAEGWFRPYTTFEKVALKNGPKVKNSAYGTFAGSESKLYDLGHGWDGMFGAYIGYNGSHQRYDSVSIYQNGGTLGALGMLYKGNFFSGLTINAGANIAEASTMYGNDDFTMLMGGIASKTGYNIELADGKFIIQPSWLMSYSFVNTFDYTSSAGTRLNSDTLMAIQLQPEIKFIGNLKNGWQPYISGAMIWNIMDDTKFKANDVSLPEMSIKPYVKYGVGFRKNWGERYTGIFQSYITNGGRNGVGLQLGFNWVLGN